MGSLEVPSQGPEVIKVPTSNYEFGANYLDPKVLFCQVKFMSCVFLCFHHLNVFPLPLR